MITEPEPSVSDRLSLEETVARLKVSPLVDGIAQFGSRTTSQASVSSDYDLLILVRALPARVFQMVTTIDGRLADIVLVETETADALLTAKERPKARTFEALFAQKMRTAHIVHDPSRRLSQVQQLVTGSAWDSDDIYHQSDYDLYMIRFWLSHGLMHLERLSRSPDPIQHSAADMMLTSNLPEAWRNYFVIRQIPWEGEKAAIRYWAEHDPGYWQTVKACLEIGDRTDRLAKYRELVESTLAPIGKVFNKGETAVMLANSNSLIDVQRTLHYWRMLLDI
jgi:hypothetical protein